MRKLLFFTLLIVPFMMLSSVQAANVALFVNTTYVDYSPGAPYSEASNLEATLTLQGHTVTTFTGITATDFTNAVTGQDVLIIPEQERNELNPDLDADARAAIANFVNGGGIFIGSHDWDEGFVNLANNVFGFSLIQGSTYGGPWALNAAGAAGTTFAGGPASLSYNDGTVEILLASLPPSTKVIYDDGTGTVVFMAPYGSGWVILIGWDWYDAAPVGDQDGGWLSVLNSAVTVNGGSECEWSPEAAWSDGERYMKKGNWATYTTYWDGKTATLYAGQTMDAGIVEFEAGAPGTVNITITLNKGWRFADVKENVKIEGYGLPPKGQPRPGRFTWKDEAATSPFSIVVDAAGYYGVHVDVEWEDCSAPE